MQGQQALTATTRGLTLAALLIGQVTAFGAEPFTRSTDKNVKRLIESIADGEKRFEKALDSKLKHSVIRGPRGEVDVENYLDDLETSIENFDDRFSSKYSASAELGDLLVRAKGLHDYVRHNPAIKGASEWDLVANDLNALAVAYGQVFPPADNAAFRRIGDKELADAIAALSRESSNVASALKKAAKGVPALATSSATGAADLSKLATSLKALKSRLSDAKPATAEARVVLAGADKIAAVMKDAAMPATVTDAWSAAGVHVDKIAQAFGMVHTPSQTPPQ